MSEEFNMTLPYATEIFTTGAFLDRAYINGKWYWVVSCFEDDTFQGEGMTGKCIDPDVVADTKEGLINRGVE